MCAFHPDPSQADCSFPEEVMEDGEVWEDNDDEEEVMEADDDAEVMEVEGVETAAAAVLAAAVVKEAEGYKLFLNSKSATGYKGVTKRPDGTFRADFWDSALTNVSLGSFQTAVEAAVAYAKHMAASSVYPDENGQEPGTSLPAAVALPAAAVVPAAVVKEAEGYKLFLSSKSASGYQYVRTA